MRIEERGAGPAVVLLHGTPSPVSYFSPIIEPLSASRRVLCPVIPGYDGTAPHPGGYRLAEMTRLLEDELAARGVTEAAVLGYSYGGYRALSLALSKRLRVTRLYLMAPFAGFDDAERAERLQLAAAIRGPGLDLRSIFIQVALAPAFVAANPDAAAEVGAWVDLVSREVIAAEVEASGLDEDLRPRLGELEVPVLCRVGELDAGALPRRSQAIVERVRDATLELVPGCGHAPLLEDRAATVASVMKFLAG